jgi:hypothetical protein
MAWAAWQDRAPRADRVLWSSRRILIGRQNRNRGFIGLLDPAGLVTAGVESAITRWLQVADFTADRVGLLAVGDMSLGGVSLPAQGEAAGSDAPSVSGRLLDTDGDGRNDLFLFDGDADGTVDVVERGLDTNGDGLNDTFVTYNEQGRVRGARAGAGRLDPDLAAGHRPQVQIIRLRT